MKLRLHLDGKNIFSEDEWEKIHDAFQFFVDEYKLHKHNIPVYVKFEKTLSLESNVSDGIDHSRGCCITQFRQFATKVHVDRFVLKIAADNLTRTVETIFHEMTHVMQELRGDIVRQYDGSETYKGVNYSVDKLIKPTYNEYRSFPWEVEARKVSAEMLTKWCKSRNVKLSFWQKLINFWS